MFWFHINSEKRRLYVIEADVFIETDTQSESISDRNYVLHRLSDGMIRTH